VDDFFQEDRFKSGFFKHANEQSEESCMRKKLGK